MSPDLRFALSGALQEYEIGTEWYIEPNLWSILYLDWIRFTAYTLEGNLDLVVSDFRFLENKISMLGLTNSIASKEGYQDKQIDVAVLSAIFDVERKRRDT